MTRTLLSAALALCLTATGAFAQDWTLNPDTSRLAFGSVKNHNIGEVHTFEGLNGTVSRDGNVVVEIPLTGVSTNIDIRNERLGEYVFAGAPMATLSGTIDMAEFKSLRPGKSDIIEMDAVLSFLGQDVDVSTELFVVRTSARSVMVTTNDMVMLTTEDLGIDAGIDILQQLANLEDITRVTPVTIRFVFER